MSRQGKAKQGKARRGKAKPVVCNHKTDGNQCCRPRHVTSGGMTRAKCTVHFNAAKKESTLKLNAKRSDEDPDNLLSVKRESIRQSGQRMQHYRKGRKDDLNLITEPNVTRIATILDTIKNDNEYVIVQNAIKGPINTDNFIEIGNAEAISFSGQKGPYKRWMQDIEQPEFLADVRSAIQHVFPKCIHYNVKCLTSYSGDIAQDLHQDFVPDDSTCVMHDLKVFHFSAIVSIQNGTKLIIGSEKEIVPIPLYSMLLFRGDMTHAGAGYDEENSRIFISVSSELFPQRDGVLLITYQ